jgi:hypothetical protein
MKRALALVGAMVVMAVAAAPAVGAVFIRVTTLRVHTGGVARLVGDATRMPLFALPASRMPCAKYNTCVGPIHRAKEPTRSPFVFLGYTPGATTGMIRPRLFSLRLPRALHAGKYVVFVWCRSCGGSLIVAGSDPSGQPQILDVRP